MNHLNCRSIANKHDLLKYHVKTKSPDVFTISESWLHSDLPSSHFVIPGFNFERLDRSWTANGKSNPTRGGGVAVYLADYLPYSATDLERFNLSSSIGEILWLSLHLPNQRKIIIGTVYRPPQGNVKDFINYLQDSLLEISADSNADIFLMGDFNIDYANPRANGRKELKELESVCGMKQFITGFTRYSATPSLIDLVFSNSDYILESGTESVNVSDHEAIYVIRKKRKENHPRIESYGRSYANYEQNHFEHAARTGMSIIILHLLARHGPILKQ